MVSRVRKDQLGRGATLAQPGRQGQPAQKVIPAQLEQSDPKVTLEQPEPRAQKVIPAQLGQPEPLVRKVIPGQVGLPVRKAQSEPLVLLGLLVQRAPSGLRVRRVWLVRLEQKATPEQPEQPEQPE